MSQAVQENKMGTMPVGPLLINMSLPIVISMLVQALYNVVDSYFVAQVSENALTAVSLAFPVQNLMISIAAGTGVGFNALLSKSLGEKNYKLANNTASNGIFLSLMSFLVMLILGLLFSRTFFTAQNINIPEVVQDGSIYLKICTMFSLGLFMQICTERLLQATGKTFYSMIVQASGAITNIILDPLLIFGIGPFPEMGVAGAAIATVIGQSVSASLGIYYNLAHNKEITISMRRFKPDLYIIRVIYSVGLPAILMRSITSVMTFGMNRILFSFTSTATAVMGIYYKLESIITMPIFGINNGMIPILAYNYGAKRKDRIIKTVKLALIASIIITLIGFCLLFFLPEYILNIFNATPEMLIIGVPALKTIGTVFILAGISIIFTAVFQALGKAFYSLTMSLVRQLVVLLPVAYFLSRLGNINLVWLAFPISEAIAIVLASGFMTRLYRREIKNLGSETCDS